MSAMFSEASVFNADISGWDTSKVANMDSMFQAASQFNQNLTGWSNAASPTVVDMFSANSPSGIVLMAMTRANKAA